MTLMDPATFYRQPHASPASREEAFQTATALGHTMSEWRWCGCEPDCRRYTATCTACGHGITERRGTTRQGEALYLTCDGIEGRQRRAAEFAAFLAIHRSHEYIDIDTGDYAIV